MTSVIRNRSPKDSVINDIINREWAMFQLTNNMGGRAGCQDQFNTFYANRYSQHSAWQGDTLESYRNDLISAEMAGRNLITEKYAYMMEFTDPAYYEAKLRDRLPVLSQEKAALVAEIVSCQLIAYEEYARRFPVLAGAGRPETESGADTSIRDYSIGEYRTYSETTLRLLLRDLKKLENPVMEIQRTLVTFYGYNRLEEAEEARKRA